MPARDGTGPQGTGPHGRKMGSCRNTALGVSATDTAKDTVKGEKSDTQTSVTYGVGRGRKHRGCGNGLCGGRHQ